MGTTKAPAGKHLEQEGEGMNALDNPCATCSNRDCANGMLAKWWDLCLESKFTLFKQIAPPLPEKEEQEPWPGDGLDCPNCGGMLELVEGGMLACHLCGFADNDTAEVE